MEEESTGSKAEAPRPYVPQGRYLANVYWKKPAIVVLRVLQLIFTLIAFSVMADVLHDAFNDIESFQYTLAINVLAFLYALGQLSFSICCIVRGGSSSSSLTPIYHYSTFILDQIMAYFLISCGSAIAAVLHVSGLCDSSSKFCSRLTGCATLVFLAFIAFAAASVISGYYLVKWILKA